MLEPDIDNYEPEFAGGYKYAHDELKHWLLSEGTYLSYEEVIAKIEELDKPPWQLAVL